jgi:hypothetical protein
MVITCSRGTDGNYYFYDSRKKQRVSQPRNFSNWSSCKDSKALLAKKYIEERTFELADAQDALLLVDGLVNPKYRVLQLEAKLKAKEDAIDSLNTILDKCSPAERLQYDELKAEVESLKKKKTALHAQIDKVNINRKQVIELKDKIEDIKKLQEKLAKEKDLNKISKIRKQIVDIISKYSTIINFTEHEMLSNIFISDEHYGPSLNTGLELIKNYDESKILEKLDLNYPANRVFIHLAASLAAQLSEVKAEKV